MVAGLPASFSVATLQKTAYVLHPPYNFCMASNNSFQPLHTYTVLTHVRISSASLTYIALMPVTTSTLLGTLKLYDSYTTALLHGEGISIISGTEKTDILDLKMRAHAWLDQTRGTRI